MISFFPERAVALQVFGFQIHWYGLMYLFAFLLAAALLPRLQKYRGMSLTRDEWLELVTWSVLGVVIGGRLGYVLFYQPAFFLRNPAEIFMVWNGGMAFHGGLLGVSVVLSYICWKKKYAMLRIADIVVVPVALGLALGRIGNFVNGELYGTITTLPWGMEFPGVEGLRHPNQLYECLYSLVIALCGYLHLRLAPKARPGKTFALFLILYGIFRFLTEYVRVQDYALTMLGPLTLTRGQLLNIPVLIAGIVLWLWLSKNPAQK
jgi:phosphatidylglycerol---prolipoprotein diacylglyceryl transferase